MSVWDSVIEGAAKVGGAYLSNSGGDGNNNNGAKIQPSTTGTTQLSDFDIMYNAASVQSMYDLTSKLDQWSNMDQNFFQNTFQPFQEKLIQTNSDLLPSIEKVAGSTLEANARDLTQNETLKNMFRTSVAGTERQFSGQIDSLLKQVDSVPSEQERVGQALASVESQFGQAGKALTRDVQSRGQAVSQASKRSMEFEKAKAKAGAAGSAAEAARAEKMAATERTLGVLGQKSGQATSQLLGVQGGQQAGLATPQVGGVTPTTGLAGAQLQADLEKTGSQQTFGTRTRDDRAVQVQKGVTNPALTSGATGQMPSAGANMMYAGGNQNFNEAGGVTGSVLGGVGKMIGGVIGTSINPPR